MCQACEEAGETCDGSGSCGRGSALDGPANPSAFQVQRSGSAFAQRSRSRSQFYVLPPVEDDAPTAGPFSNAMRSSATRALLSAPASMLPTETIPVAAANPDGAGGNPSTVEIGNVDYGGDGKAIIGPGGTDGGYLSGGNVITPGSGKSGGGGSDTSALGILAGLAQIGLNTANQIQQANRQTQTTADAAQNANAGNATYPDGVTVTTAPAPMSTGAKVGLGVGAAAAGVGIAWTIVKLVS